MIFVLNKLIELVKCDLELTNEKVYKMLKGFFYKPINAYNRTIVFS